MVVFLEESEGAFCVAGWFQGKLSTGINNIVNGSILLSESMTRFVRLRQTSKGGQK